MVLEELGFAHHPPISLVGPVSVAWLAIWAVQVGRAPAREGGVLRTDAVPGTEA